MNAISYECPRCQATQAVLPTATRTRSPWGQNDHPRLLCQCGAPLIRSDQAARYRNGEGMLLTLAYLMDWSTCPLAHICDGWDVYDPRQCEQGVVRQQCLIQVHQSMAEAQSALAVIQQRLTRPPPRAPRARRPQSK